MEAAQNTFISSTFWTERIGPTAALKTLEIMERDKSWEQITSLGNYMRKKWESISKRYNVEINISGIPSISTFNFVHEDAKKFSTYLTQDFLKKGFLANNNFYASTAHSKDIIDNYTEVLEEIFQKIEACIKGDDDINRLLKGPVSHDTFKRLN